jgi:hypothetical protein
MDTSEPITIVIIAIVVIIILFLLFREINCWYWKINERISLMEEQNSLLRKLLSGNNVQEEIETDIIEKTPIEEEVTYSAPEIVSQTKSNKNSLFSGSYEKIQLEFADGVKGSIYYRQSQNVYYFKGKDKLGRCFCSYDNFTNCANALHYFETKGEVLKVGFIASFL